MVQFILPNTCLFVPGVHDFKFFIGFYKLFPNLPDNDKLCSLKKDIPIDGNLKILIQFSIRECIRAKALINIYSLYWKRPIKNEKIECPLKTQN